jgi:hypothetical protein
MGCEIQDGVGYHECHNPGAGICLDFGMEVCRAHLLRCIAERHRVQVYPLWRRVWEYFRWIL